MAWRFWGSLPLQPIILGGHQGIDHMQSGSADSAGDSMAIVRHLARQQLEVDSKHTETKCTYSIVQSRDGKTYLQVDTYGSKERKIAGKKSQSIRFAPEAIRELKSLLNSHF